MWQRDAASSRPASCGLILFKSWAGEPLRYWFKNPRHLLFFKVNQVFVILEDPDVGKSSPSILNFFSSYSLLRLLLNLFLLFLVTSPSPLDLNCCDMIHGESVVFEKSSCQWHFIRWLNNTRTEVTHALFFALLHVIEGRSQKLLSKWLMSGEVLLLSGTSLQI